MRRLICTAQFSCDAFARSCWRRRSRIRRRAHAGIAACANRVPTVGELLKFVVNSRLPIGRSRQQHYITESSRRHETCSGGVVSVDLGLEEEDSQGFGITPTWKPAKGTEMIARIAVLLFALSAGGAEAHDYWADGKARSRLGEGFVLRAGGRAPSSPRPGAPDLRRLLLRSTATSAAFPVGQALPSQDGDYWIFYRDDGRRASPASIASSCRWPSDFRRGFRASIRRRS